MTESLVGTLLDGKHRVDSIIGNAHAGGMVYRGRDIESNAMVVIRCPAVPANVADLDAALDAFVEEASLLARICAATTDVERLLASGVELTSFGRAPFCVYEWLAGRSLEKDLAGRTGVSSIGEALTILEPAARALAAAHVLGGAHRDVRPANLWLAEVDGRTRLKVAAFGLATRVGPGPTAFAPEYGAPEHFKSSYGALGPQTDVYGLALTIVEMISGKRALEGADAGDLFLATSDLGKRPTLRARGAHVSDAVEAVIARALAVDPRRRWAHAREMWDALVAAVPELTPAPPSVKPQAFTPLPLASSPPGIGARERSDRASSTASLGVTAPRSVFPSSRPSLPPLDDARLDSARTGGSAPVSLLTPPKKGDRSGAWAWLAVAGLGVTVIGVVVAKVGSDASKHPTTVLSSSASASASVPPPSSAPPPSPPPVPSKKASLDGMVRVPAGPFVMGSDKDNKSEKPAHKVKLTRAFYIDRTEVTAEAWGACVDDKECAAGKVHGADIAETTWGCNAKDKPKQPANCVDRAQAEKFCAWAGKRLPTEAEWEYAARGTDGRDYPWGGAPPTTCKQAILTGMTGDCGERHGTVDVGTTVDGKSPFGALDMAGNVWEWVADGYQDYTPGDVTDPRAPSSARGVLRGGSWDYATTSAKTTYRLVFPATSGNVSIGFRCAVDAPD